MAGRATASRADEQDLLLTDLVLAECVYVLESFYEVERARVAELMRSAIGLRTIKTVDPAVLLRALEVYELDGLDFAEANLVALAEATGVNASCLLTARSIGSSRSPGTNPDLWTMVHCFDDPAGLTSKRAANLDRCSGPSRRFASLGCLLELLHRRTDGG